MLHGFDSFDQLEKEEKLGILMLMKFRQSELRVDSKAPSMNNLYHLSKSPDETSTLYEKKKFKTVRASPSKSKSIEKLDKLKLTDIEKLDCKMDEDKSQCHLCLRCFNRKYELERHLKTVHVEPVKCGYCFKNLKLMNRRYFSTNLGTCKRNT